MKRPVFTGGYIRLLEVVGAVGILAVMFAMRDHASAEDTAAPAGKGATAWLRVGDAPGSNHGMRNQAEYDAYRKTQAARIRSQLVLLDAINKPGIGDLPILRAEKEPIRWLEEHLQVAVPLESEMLQVSLAAADREQAIKIVDGVLDSYVAQVVNAEGQQLAREYDLLQKQYNDIHREIVVKNQMLAELSQRNAHSTTSREFGRERYSNLFRLLTNVRERRLDVDLQLKSAQVRLANAAANSSEAAKAKVDVAVAEAQVEILQRARAELTAELEEIEKSTSNAARTSLGQEEIQSQIKELEQMRAKLSGKSLELRFRLQLPPRVIRLDNAK